MPVIPALRRQRQEIERVRGSPQRQSGILYSLWNHWRSMATCGILPVGPACPQVSGVGSCHQQLPNRPERGSGKVPRKMDAMSTGVLCSAFGASLPGFELPLCCLLVHVILERPLHSSVPHSLICTMGIIIPLPYRKVGRTNWIKIRKALSPVCASDTSMHCCCQFVPRVSQATSPQQNLLLSRS
jgi:hypothetical protein